jgi:hypothetical protein
MLPKTWLPPEKEIPSDTFVGQVTLAPIYTAVGSALSRWEHLESGLTRLFQLLCETPSLAACRAYGTVESCYGKSQMLRAAAVEKGQELRNNIAHGMAMGFRLGQHHGGYFLCPPSGATKKIQRGNRPYFEKLAYIYDVTDIDYCGEGFSSLLAEVGDF